MKWEIVIAIVVMAAAYLAMYWGYKRGIRKINASMYERHKIRTQPVTILVGDPEKFYHRTNGRFDTGSVEIAHYGCAYCKMGWLGVKGYYYMYCPYCGHPTGSFRPAEDND